MIDSTRRASATFVKTVIVLLPLATIRAQAQDNELTPFGAYSDVAYMGSWNQPANGTWRSKSTSASLDQLTINNLTVFAARDASSRSRWGWQLGVQAGRDIDELVSGSAGSSAETLKHLYYSNLSYLLPVGGGMLITGGLIPGNLGYESFWAIDNPTYTRGYCADLVPYFEWGAVASYPHDATLAGALYVVNGWDYLASPNHVPSYALQLNWTPRSIDLKGNVYYGPEQTETALAYWRSVGELVAEWRVDRFVFAADLGYGQEKQAAIAGNPIYDWAWGAAWLQWKPTDRWRAAIRPEYYRDDDGVATGYVQSMASLTVTLEHRVAPVTGGLLSARLEYRYDHSWGSDGGFFEGPDNEIKPFQHLLIAALMLELDRGY